MKPATLIAALLLALIAFAHLLRIVLNLKGTVGGIAIPMWVSAVAVLVTAPLAFFLWRDRRRS